MNEDEWIEVSRCDPSTISWEKVRLGFLTMGIADPDDIVSFSIEAGVITLTRIRRATRVDPVERTIKVSHR